MGELVRAERTERQTSGHNKCFTSTTAAMWASVQMSPEAHMLMITGKAALLCSNAHAPGAGG